MDKEEFMHACETNLRSKLLAFTSKQKAGIAALLKICCSNIAGRLEEWDPPYVPRITMILNNDLTVMVFLESGWDKAASLFVGL